MAGGGVSAALLRVRPVLGSREALNFLSTAKSAPLLLTLHRFTRSTVPRDCLGGIGANGKITLPTKGGKSFGFCATIKKAFTRIQSIARMTAAAVVVGVSAPIWRAASAAAARILAPTHPRSARVIWCCVAVRALSTRPVPVAAKRSPCDTNFSVFFVFF